MTAQTHSRAAVQSRHNRNLFISTHTGQSEQVHSAFSLLARLASMQYFKHIEVASQHQLVEVHCSADCTHVYNFKAICEARALSIQEPWPNILCCLRLKTLQSPGQSHAHCMLVKWSIFTRSTQECSGQLWTQGAMLPAADHELTPGTKDTEENTLTKRSILGPR